MCVSRTTIEHPKVGRNPCLTLFSAETLAVRPAPKGTYLAPIDRFREPSRISAAQKLR